MTRGDHPHTMSSEAMKAVFDNLTSGAGRRAELEYKADSAAHPEADSTEVSLRSMRLSTQMHVTDWAEAQCEDPEIEAAMDWCLLDRRKSQPWTEQLAKLKSRLGAKKNTPKGRSILRNTDKLTLSGELLYYRYKPKYHIEEVKCFIAPRAHWMTAIDGCHCDTGHQGKKRMDSGGLESLRMSTRQSRTVSGVSFTEVPVMVTTPLQLVHLDFTSFKTTTNLNE